MSTHAHAINRSYVTLNDVRLRTRKLASISMGIDGIDGLEAVCSLAAGALSEQEWATAVLG